MPQDETCSFCNRPRNEVEALIPSPRNSQVFICDACIDQGSSALREERLKDTSSAEEAPLPKPLEIVTALDSYVIGQSMAKRAVAAAVYKHYKRREAERLGLKLDVEIQKSNILMTGPSGCHRRGQKVLMFDGSLKVVEDVRVGDQLMGPDSRPRRVMSLVRGHDTMVEVSPTKGRPWVVNLDHILTLARAKQGKKVLVDVSVREWLLWSKTQKSLHKLVRTGVDFRPTRTLPIDPYALGLLLGDGSLWGSPQIHTESEEVLAASRKLAQQFGLKLTQYHENEERCPTYAFVQSKGGPPTINPLSFELARLELWGTRAESKFVPHLYKTASREDRLALLAGYLDTDGSLHSNTYDVSSKSQALLEDMAFVARSLGFATYPQPCTKRSQNGTEGLYYRMLISGDTSLIPVRIREKKASKRKQIKSVLHTGFTAKLLPEEDYYGFQLDGDHRYLLDDFTITHNCGKTQIARTIARLLKVPFFIQDCTKLTQAGYVGEDVDVVVQGLLEKCAHDPNRAKWGVVVLDEIDKLARKSGRDAAGYRDAAGEGVQQALLKLIEGDEVTVARGMDNRIGMETSSLSVDTTNILFIGMGSFDGIQDVIRRRVNKDARLGFGAQHKQEVDIEKVYREMSEDDILDFGIIPELAGRMPVLTSVLPLKEDELVRVLTEPKDALVKQMKALYMMDGIDLQFEDDALRTIAKKAAERKTGARALRGIIETLMNPWDLETPSMSDLRVLRVTRDFVEGKGLPVLVHDGKKRTAEA